MQLPTGASLNVPDTTSFKMNLTAFGAKQIVKAFQLCSKAPCHEHGEHAGTKPPYPALLPPPPRCWWCCWTAASWLRSGKHGRCLHTPGYARYLKRLRWRYGCHKNTHALFSPQSAWPSRYVVGVFNCRTCMRYQNHFVAQSSSALYSRCY